MQIEAWDCVCNQPCTLIHTSNDEDVPIQLVSDIQLLLNSQTQLRTQDDAHNIIYSPTNILEDGATSIHILDDMPTASHVEVLSWQGNSNPIQFYECFIVGLFYILIVFQCILKMDPNDNAGAPKK